MAGVEEFLWPVRVYYEDTDGGGVVYHANYLKFMERARTEWLRSLGFEQTELRTRDGILFVVHDMQIQFRKPARFNDELVVTSRLLKVGRSLLQFEQVILHGDVCITEAVVDVVCIDAERFRPVSMPAAIKQAISSSLPKIQPIT
jgi:acyl-CoA thioester hydrolase